MKHFGLVGHPLSHSFSEAYFTEKFQIKGIDADYRLFDFTPFPSKKTLQSLNLEGFNVTIPYKEKAVTYMDELSKEAEEIGAVNCVKNMNGHMIGHNTDWLGFKSSLLQVCKKPIHHALVFGSGGSSKAVQYALNRLKISYQVVSRSGKVDYDTISTELVKKSQLLVNTTPLGMHPDINSKPSIPFEAIGDGHIVFDLIYNPEKTLFLKLAESNGAYISNGYNMLVEQAEASWSIWNA